MFLLDVKDFRKHSTVPVSVGESQVAAALADAGIDFEKPLELRFRVKDMTHSRKLASSEPVGPSGDVYRLNLYVMPGATELSDKVLAKFNRRIRHELKHMAQFRSGGGWTDPEVAAEREAEAFTYEQHGSGAFFPVG